MFPRKILESFHIAKKSSFINTADKIYIIVLYRKDDEAWLKKWNKSEKGQATADPTSV